MFDKKTLIVVGAGASKEANLPTGYELKHRISAILDIRFEDGNRQISGDHVVCDAIRRALQRENSNERDINAHLHAAWKIRNAMPLSISIDNYIDAHQGDSKLELCGKLAIVQSILEAERNSLLHIYTRSPNNGLNYHSLEGTWFNSFIQLLTENCRAEQLEERLTSISLIVFNYDRCIEHFLYHSLQTYYNIDPERAAILVRGIKIYHPYGTVGALPWYLSNHAVEFGAKPNSDQLVNLAGQIKTFTEGTDPESSDVVAIRNGVSEARIVLFLGFAFHRQNLDMIRPPQSGHLNPDEVRYFGTAHGISKSDCDVISSELVELGGAKRTNINLRDDLTCFQLFREYWRSLSLS